MSTKHEKMKIYLFVFIKQVDLFTDKFFKYLAVEGSNR